MLLLPLGVPPMPTPVCSTQSLAQDHSVLEGAHCHCGKCNLGLGGGGGDERWLDKIIRLAELTEMNLSFS